MPCVLTGAALTGAESGELQEVLEETNVRTVDLTCQRTTDLTLMAYFALDLLPMLCDYSPSVDLVLACNEYCIFLL